MEPLGRYGNGLPAEVTIAVGVLSIVAATALLELSRTLAETYRGRWFAGNGRDVFHVLALLVLGSAMMTAGLSGPLAAVAAATTMLLPLLVLDALPARRPARVASLAALIAVAAAAPLLEPAAFVSACNATARALF